MDWVQLKGFVIANWPLLAVFPGVPALLSILAMLGLHRKLVPLKEVAGFEVLGRAKFLVVFLRKDDFNWKQSTIAHEYEHIRQQWLLGIVGYVIWSLIADKSRKKWAETGAYKVSIKHGLPLEEAARRLRRYGYNSKAAAKRALK